MNAARHQLETGTMTLVNAIGELVNPCLYGLDPTQTWLTVPGLMRRFGDVSRNIVNKALMTGKLKCERRPNMKPSVYIALAEAERWIYQRRISDHPPLPDDDDTDTNQLRLF